MVSLPLKIIVDANILFSFFKSDSVRRRIIKELLKIDCEFISPEVIFDELIADKSRILKYSAISDSEFSYLFALLDKQVNKISKEKYEQFLPQAKQISPHDKDLPYFAVALALNCSIWSDEKAFKQQSKMEIFSTKELLAMLEKI